MIQPEFRTEYINPRFGELFRGAAQSYGLRQGDLCAVIGEAVGRTRNALLADFALYNQGNMLGRKLRLTVNSQPSALEIDIGRLLEVMYAMSIPAESESKMLAIILEETNLELNYPPIIQGERLTRPYNQSE